MEEFEPDWISCPGDTVLDSITEKKLDINSCIEALGLSETEFRDLVFGQLAIDNTLAEKLSSLLGPTAEFWLQREEDFQKRLKEIKNDN